MYPVSALLFLAAVTFTEEMLEDIRSAYLADPQGLGKSLVKVDTFLENEATGIPPERRRAIIDAIGLYGVSLVRDALAASPGLTLADMRVCEDTLQSFRAALRPYQDRRYLPAYTRSYTPGARPHIEPSPCGSFRAD